MAVSGHVCHVHVIHCTHAVLIRLIAFVHGSPRAGDLGFAGTMTLSFCGHQDNPEKTAANIRGDFWLLGDRGIKDEDGYFQFMGRADDIINSSG